MLAAVFHRKLEVCQYLYERGAVDSIRSNGNASPCSPMEAACSLQDIRIADWLFAKGASEDIHLKDKAGRSLLRKACEKDSFLKVAKWLFEKGAGEEIHEKDVINGNTLLHHACARGQLEMAKWLVSVGADFRAKNFDEETPVFVAVMRRNFRVAAWLFEIGAHADIRTSDIDGDTLLSLSCAIEFFDVVEWLILNGVAYDETGTFDCSNFLSDTNEVDNYCSLIDPLKKRLNSHSAFMHVLCCVSTSKQVNCVKKPRDSVACRLPMLGGHEDTVLKIIAMYADIPFGNSLRYVRDALVVLEECSAKAQFEVLSSERESAFEAVGEAQTGLTIAEDELTRAIELAAIASETFASANAAIAARLNPAAAAAPELLSSPL
jgi:hypothetical protein